VVASVIHSRYIGLDMTRKLSVPCNAPLDQQAYAQFEDSAPAAAAAAQNSSAAEVSVSSVRSMDSQIGTPMPARHEVNAEIQNAAQQVLEHANGPSMSQAGTGRSTQEHTQISVPLSAQYETNAEANDTAQPIIEHFTDPSVAQAMADKRKQEGSFRLCSLFPARHGTNRDAQTAVQSLDHASQSRPAQARPDKRGQQQHIPSGQTEHHVSFRSPAQASRATPRKRLAAASKETGTGNPFQHFTFSGAGKQQHHPSESPNAHTVTLVCKAATVALACSLFVAPELYIKPYWYTGGKVKMSMMILQAVQSMG